MSQLLLSPLAAPHPHTCSITTITNPSIMYDALLEVVTEPHAIFGHRPGQHGSVSLRSDSIFRQKATRRMFNNWWVHSRLATNKIVGQYKRHAKRSMIRESSIFLDFRIHPMKVATWGVI